MKPLMLCAIVLLIHVADANTCVKKGRIYTEKRWYGYLLQKTFDRNTAKIQYQFSYPVAECCTNLVIYYDDQLKLLNENMDCWERIGILPADNNQIIPLTVGNGTVGCKIYNETGEPLYVCTGERSFRSSGPRTWYVALSRCGSNGPLNMNYFFNVTGFYGECEHDSLADATFPTIVEEDKYLNVAIALGATAGLTAIVAAVFIVLWCFGRRQQKKKTGSVTSSQATMTQDVFYVNPSLSDREQSDSQYSQSTGSSENYYEVIPDRRSYESINLQLSGHGGRHHNNHATLPKENRPSLPAYIFEDYPPPPYQPPQQLLQAINSHSQNGQHSFASAGTHPHTHILAGGSNGHQPQNSHTNAVNSLSVPNGYAGGGHPSAGPSQSNSSHQLVNVGQMSNTGHAVALTGTQSPSGVHLALNAVGGGQLSANGVQQMANTSFQSSGAQAQTNMGTGPRPNRNQLPNGNVIKLLNQAYRIQQFETTA